MIVEDPRACHLALKPNRNNRGYAPYACEHQERFAEKQVRFVSAQTSKK